MVILLMWLFHPHHALIREKKAVELKLELKVGRHLTEQQHIVEAHICAVPLIRKSSVRKSFFFPDIYQLKTCQWGEQGQCHRSELQLLR